jgi:hypothetical protein
MLYVIIISFALAAVVGLIILKNWLTAQKTPRTTIYMHGILAALGLVLLIIYYVENGAKSLQTELSLFVIAALGGFYMFFREIKGKMSPTWLAIVHALIAVTGFLFVILMLF